MERTIVRFLQRHLTYEQYAELIGHGIGLIGPAGLRRWVAERDAEAFAKLYFPSEFTLDLAPIHRTFTADIQEIRRRALARLPGLKVARAIPRGHSKTSWYSRLLPLHGMLYGWSPLTVLLGNNATAAERLVKNIRDELEGNAQILEDFGDLRGPVWQVDQLQAANDCTIRCFGVGSGAVRGVSRPGVRPSLIVGDDLDDDQAVRSAIQLEHNRDWWDKAVMALGDQVAFTTSYAVIGTIIRASSLMQHTLDSADFQATTAQGVVRFADNSALWEQWRSWYIAEAKAGQRPAGPEEDAFYGEHQAAMLAGTAVLWDRPHAYYHLMIYRLSRGDAAFFSEIQNQPSEVGGNLGKLPLMARPTDLSEWSLLAALDPTTKGGKTNDKAAWIEAYFHRRRKEILISLCDARQRSAAETIRYAADRLRRSVITQRYEGIWCEANAAGSLIAEAIEDSIARDNLNYMVTQVTNTAPKDVRIGMLSHYAARQQLYAVDDIDPEFISEWNDFPGYRFDDALDAAATIVQQLKLAGLLDLV